MTSAGPRTSPPTSLASWPAVKTAGGATVRLPGVAQPLDDGGGDVESPIRRDDPVTRGRDIEDDAKIALGPQPLDDRLDAFLERRDELPLSFLGALAEFLGPPVEGLLHRADLGLTCLTLRLGQPDRALLVGRDRGVHLIAHPLDFVLEPLELPGIGGLGGLIAWRLLQDH